MDFSAQRMHRPQPESLEDRFKRLTSRLRETAFLLSAETLIDVATHGLVETLGACCAHAYFVSQEGGEWSLVSASNHRSSGHHKTPIATGTSLLASSDWLTHLIKLPPRGHSLVLLDDSDCEGLDLCIVSSTKLIAFLRDWQNNLQWLIVVEGCKTEDTSSEWFKLLNELVSTLAGHFDNISAWRRSQELQRVSPFDRGQMLDHLLKSAVNQANAQGAVLLSVDSNAGMLRCAAHYPKVTPHFRFFRFDKGADTLSTRALATGQLQSSNDPWSDQRVWQPALNLFKIKGRIIALPLDYDDLKRGVLLFWGSNVSDFFALGSAFQLQFGALLALLASHQAEQARIHATIETLPASVFQKNLKHKFVLANSEFCKALRQPIQKILDQTDYHFFRPDIAKRFHEGDKIAQEKGTYERLEEEIPNREETLVVHTKKNAIYDADGIVVGVQGVFLDVTASKRLKTTNEGLREDIDELLQAKKELELAETRANMGHWSATMGIDKTFTASAQLCRMFGVTEGDLTVAMIVEQCEGVDSSYVLEMFDGRFDTAAESNRTFMIRRGNEIRRFRALTQRLHIEADLFRLEGTIQDITDLVAVQKNLECAAIAMTSVHQLGHILGKVNSLAEHAVEQLSSNNLETVTQTLKDISTQCHEGEVLQKETRGVATRRKDLVTNVFDIQELLVEQMKQCSLLLTSKIKGAKLTYKVTPDVDLRGCRPRCRLNQILFREVVRSICKNSVEAQEKLRKQPVPAEIAVHIDILVSKNRDQVEIRFMDNGPGFRKEMQDKEPLACSQANDEQAGFGLGLIITHAIVALHGGVLSLTNTRGATVVIKLPQVHL